jgi:polysaccharide biosynthesis protein PslH
MPEILFLAHRAPWPPDRGDRIRSWHMFQALTRLAPVHVAALCDTKADADIARAKLGSLAASLHLEVRRRSRPAALLQSLVRRAPASVTAFGNAGLARHVGGLINHGNITHVIGFSGQMGQYIPPRDRFSGPVVMDFVDVDSAKFEAYAATATNPLLRHIYAREARMLAACEAKLAARADASLFVSAAEAALFRDRSDGDKIHALENGIDTMRFDPKGDFTPLPASAGPLLVFTGQMDYHPNIDAVNWFARDVLPLVRQEHGSARFAIVGRAPTREVSALAALPGVTVTGEVPDVRPWLAAATVVVAPLLLARGVQNKLLEAMAMARPIVATPAAAEGIDAVHGEHLRIADGPAAFAKTVSALLADPASATAMGRAARQRMLDRYGWDAQLAPLTGLLGLAS